MRGKPGRSSWGRRGPQNLNDLRLWFRHVDIDDCHFRGGFPNHPLYCLLHPICRASERTAIQADDNARFSRRDHGEIDSSAERPLEPLGGVAHTRTKIERMQSMQNQKTRNQLVSRDSMDELGIWSAHFDNAAER